MHAARLGFQCLALLETKHLDLPIQDPAGSWLRTVRAGDVPFEEWLDRCVQLDRKLSYFEDSTRIGPGPDRERIEAWSARVQGRRGPGPARSCGCAR